MIEEIQWVPELLLAIKREVDRDTRPGRYLLTGPARLRGLSDLRDALPGRAETIELWPLSQGEIDSAVRDVDAAGARPPRCPLTRRCPVRPRHGCSDYSQDPRASTVN
jgi:hypothetical protein